MINQSTGLYTEITNIWPNILLYLYRDLLNKKDVTEETLTKLLNLCIQKFPDNQILLNLLDDQQDRLQKITDIIEDLEKKEPHTDIYTLFNQKIEAEKSVTENAFGDKFLDTKINNQDIKINLLEIKKTIAAIQDSINTIKTCSLTAVDHQINVQHILFVFFLWVCNQQKDDQKILNNQRLELYIEKVFANLPTYFWASKSIQGLQNIQTNNQTLMDLLIKIRNVEWNAFYATTNVRYPTVFDWSLEFKPEAIITKYINAHTISNKFIFLGYMTTLSNRLTNIIQILQQDKLNVSQIQQLLTLTSEYNKNIMVLLTNQQELIQLPNELTTLQDNEAELENDLITNRDFLEKINQLTNNISALKKWSDPKYLKPNLNINILKNEVLLFLGKEIIEKNNQMAMNIQKLMREEAFLPYYAGFITLLNDQHTHTTSQCLVDCFMLWVSKSPKISDYILGNMEQIVKNNIITEIQTRLNNKLKHLDADHLKIIKNCIKSLNIN